MSQLQPVEVHQDNDSHWYVIPKNLASQFHSLLRDCEESDDWEPFEDTFGAYRTGGDINLVQLYAEL